MWTRFFEGPTPGKCKLAPFEKFRSIVKEETRQGGGIMNQRRRKSTASHIDWISLVYGTAYCIWSVI